MHFSINSSLLAGAIKRLMPVVPAKPLIPMQSSVRIRSIDTTCVFSVASQTMQAEAALEFKGEKGFDFGIPAHVFSEVVSVLPKDVDVLFTSTEKFVTLKASQASFKLNLIPATSFPPARDYSTLPLQKTDVRQIMASIKKVSYCRNDKADREVYSAVCINTDHFVSTDGFRMSYVGNKWVPAEAGEDIMILGETADRLLKLFDKGTGDSFFYAGGGEVVAVVGNTLASCRQKVGKFAQYKTLIGSLRGASCTSHVVSRTTALESLDRAMAVTGGFDSKQVVVSFLEGAIKFASSEKTAGDASDIFSCKGPACSDPVLLNGPYIKKALQSYDDESLTFEYRGSMQPLIITNGEHVNVIQPLRGERP